MVRNKVQRLLLTVGLILSIQGCVWFIRLPVPEPDFAECITCNKRNASFDHRRLLPLVFVGGMARSGTTLMRVILDSHPKIKCGPETHILPSFLFWLTKFRSRSNNLRLELSGITNPIIDQAAASFLMEIFLRHTQSADVLCKKDPFLMLEAQYLKQLFPRAKFIFMVRDGRAVAHSIVTRKIKIHRFNLSSFEDCLTRWNSIVSDMNNICLRLGRDVCFKFHYEKLVLNPRVWLRKLFRFLEIDWDDSVLDHDKRIQEGSIKLSIMERSTDQVIKPISPDSLYKWIPHIPKDVDAKIQSIAPMLKVLGYEFDSSRVHYGDADQFVLNNSLQIVRQSQMWASRSDMIQKDLEKLRDEKGLGEG